MAGSSALQSHNWVGQHIPLHATSNGKVLLSELTDAELEEVARPAAAGAPTGRSPGRARLKSRAGPVRETGLRVAVDELEVGLTAAAAPIRNAHGDIVASMSVSGPTFRLTEDKLEVVLPLLVAAADRGVAPPRLGSGS